jgi:hypothetical protein
MGDCFGRCRVRGICDFVRLAFLALGLVILGPTPGTAQQPGRSLRLSDSRAAWRSPLFFTPDRVGSDGASPFLAITPEARVYFLPDRVLFRTRDGAFQLEFLDIDKNAEIRGEDRQGARVNYIIGSQPQEWLRDLPSYGKLSNQGIYPGVDIQFGFSGQRVKSEFVVAPGADPRQIRFRYTGLGPARINAQGDLMLATEKGEFREESPVVFQWKQRRRIEVPAKFVLSSDGAIHFDLGAYDRTLPLIIDPVVSYSSYLGGHGDTAATAIAADSSGNVYVTGWTDSIDFPTAGPLQGARGGGVDAFVVKLNPSGDRMLYATYIGGSGDDRAYGIAVDGAGNAYVTGYTGSPDFPTLLPVQSRLSGVHNAFVLKLNSAGNALVFSTYLGGSGSESGNAIALDAQGNAYVTGDTTSADFPTRVPLQASKGGKQDAFAAKIGSSGTLVYSTYLGGSEDDHGAAIAVDSTGNAYVTGGTFSSNFPTVGALQPSSGGGQDAFVAKLSPGGGNLVYSTYLGGSGGSLGALESGAAIAVDLLGNAFVAGATSSSNFPVSAALQPLSGGATDAFIAKLNPLGTALVYSTYFGGTNLDYATAIAVDASGNAFVAGYSASADLPVAAPVQGTLAGRYDAFVLELNPAGSVLDFATFFGGSGLDSANGIALDGGGNVYFAGQTFSADFPVAGGVQSSLLGVIEAFVAKLSPSVPLPDFSLSMGPASQTVAAGGSTSYTVTVTAANGFAGTVNFSVSGLPAGASGSFNPPTVTGSGSTTLTVNTATGTSAGSYTISVTGSSGPVAANIPHH